MVLLILVISIIGMFRISVSNHQSAMKVADSFALESAFNIKEHIEDYSTCPEALPNWDDIKLDHNNQEYVLRGNEHGWFRVVYSCKPDLSYSVAVFYSSDSEKYFSGDNNGTVKISYGHFTDRRIINVKDRNEMAAAIAKAYE